MAQTATYAHGTNVLAEGKTKVLLDVVGHPDLTDILSKDDITAGDGKKHDVIPGKGAVSNETACNIFRLVAKRGVPTAFVEQSGPDSFIAQKCTMFPYEIVVRSMAMGSYCQRFPQVPKGTMLRNLVTEFYLKTKDRQWKGRPLVCDDPLLILDTEDNTARLYDPHRPMAGQKPFLILPVDEVFLTEDEWKYFPEMETIARDTFIILEENFARLGFRYADFKVECGLNRQGDVLLADLIDSDSGRLLDIEGNHLDKQYYREGGDLDKLMQKFTFVAALTRHFIA